ESVRSVLQQILRIELGAYAAVRANQRAVAAFNAHLRIPLWHKLGDVALLILRRAGWKGSVSWHPAYGEAFPETIDDRRCKSLHKFRRRFRQPKALRLDGG